MVEGLLGKKIGMSQVFDEEGNSIPVTVIEVGPCTVLETLESGGRKKVRVGYMECPEKKVKKPQRGYFKKTGTSCFRVIREIALTADAPEAKTGDVLTVEVFKDIPFVDIRGRTKGRGFSGVMKRWNMHGQPASHGHTIHRKMGSAGGATDPARIFKGKRMAGRYGFENVTVQNLEVVQVDGQNNVLAVRGSIPGSRGTVVFVKRAVRK